MKVISGSSHAHEKSTYSLLISPQGLSIFFLLRQNGGPRFLFCLFFKQSCSWQAEQTTQTQYAEVALRRGRKEGHAQRVIAEKILLQSDIEANINCHNLTHTSSTRFLCMLANYAKEENLNTISWSFFCLPTMEIRTYAPNYVWS